MDKLYAIMDGDGYVGPLNLSTEKDEVIAKEVHDMAWEAEFIRMLQGKQEKPRIQDDLTPEQISRGWAVLSEQGYKVVEVSMFTVTEFEDPITDRMRETVMQGMDVHLRAIKDLQEYHTPRMFPYHLMVDGEVPNGGRCKIETLTTKD